MVTSTTGTEGSAADRPRARRIRGLDAEQRRSQRREQILDAALDLFTDRGYANTPIELICQTAFVSTKSFYEVLDSREGCYLALYERTAAEFRDHMSEALASAPAEETAAAAHLLRAYVRMLVADPRKAQITFGNAGTISAAVEHGRRENRRWAAKFIEALWTHNGVTGDHHRIAVAVVGGMFDVITEWLLDTDTGQVDADAERTLVDDLRDFYIAVRHGIATLPGNR